MNPKILITGGSGLLGSYLIRWLRKNGYTQLYATHTGSMETVPADLREGIHWQTLVLPDLAGALDVIEGCDWVIHTAGLVSYLPKDKYRLLEINQSGTEHVVNACLQHQVSHLVYIGSIGALGKEKDHLTLNESSPWLDNEFSTPYGLSKYLGELEVWRGAGEGLHVSVVLPSVILGTGAWHRSSLQLVNRIATKSPWYPGGQTGYVDVRDVASFIGLLLERPITGERWIVNGENKPYREIYHEVASLIGINKKFKKAPKWLAKGILHVNNLMGVKGVGIDIVNQAYGTFSFDASKSLSVGQFTYRDFQVTLKEVVEAYVNKTGIQVLAF